MNSDTSYNRIRAELDRKLAENKQLRVIAEKIRSGKADFRDTAKYSQIVSHIMGDVLSKNIGSITNPLGKELVCKELLKAHYKEINDVLGDVQASVDKDLGIHIKPVKAPFPAERVDRAAHSLEDPTVPIETIERRARSVTENIGESMHDDYIKENARFRDKAGLKCYLTRDAGGGCCKWCQALEGRYDYATAPDDVFRRHDNCTCTVTYECGRMRQDVWSKKTWQASEEELKARRRLSETSKPKSFRNGELRELSEQSRPMQLNAEQAEALQNRILAVPNDSESALKYVFVEAKSIEEAQLYAKQFCNDGFMAKNFKGEVDFKGISVESANAINKALSETYSKIELEKLSGIKTVSPTSALGKKAFKDGADAVFSYDPIQHGIYVNKDVLKNEKTFAEYVKRSEDSWNTVMNNIDKLSGSQKELALVYQNAGRSLVDGNTVEGMFTHELGHHAQWTLLDAKTNNSVGSKMSEYAPKISGYANASKSEYLAESFSAYMKGERNLLDPEYVKFLDEKSIDNGAKSGIIKESSKQKLITEITDKAIDSVPKLNISGYSDEQCTMIQKQHKELLEYSRKNNENKEVAFVFDSSLGNRKEFMGSDDKIDFGRILYGSDITVLHNHPRNSSYSVTDIIFFGDNSNVKTLTIVKNNGKVEYLTKSKEFDPTVFKLEYDRLYRKIVKTGTDSEKDKFVKTLLNKSKSGVIWSERT